MLNIPIGYAVILTEYVCGACSNEFYAVPGAATLACAYCRGTSYANGEVKLYVKGEVTDTTPLLTPDEEKFNAPAEAALKAQEEVFYKAIDELSEEGI